MSDEVIEIIEPSNEIVTSFTESNIINVNKNYNNLTNRPKINNVLLQGELSLDDLGIPSDYIKKTDYADVDLSGVIKVNSGKGTTVTSTGYLAAAGKTYSQYQDASDDIFVSKKTLDNVIVGKSLANEQYVKNYVDSLDARNVTY